MATFTRAVWLLVPIASVLSLGCEEGASSTATTAAAVATTKATAAPLPKPAAAAAATAQATGDTAKPKRGPGRGAGFAGMLIGAARDLELKDAQKLSVDAIERSLEPSESDRAEQKSLHADMAAAVKAGTLDAAKLAPRFDAIEKAMKAHQEKQVEALDALHKTLEPAQRKAVVAAVRAKQAARAEHAGERAKGPHNGDWAKRGLERITKELDLDAAQQKTVEAMMAADKPALPKMEGAMDEMKKHMETLLTAFEADTFDAKKLELGPPMGKGPREGFDKHIAFLSKLVAALKPEQREKLATSVAQGPGHRMGRPGAPGAGFGMPFGDDQDDADEHGAPAPAAPATK